MPQSIEFNDDKNGNQGGNNRGKSVNSSDGENNGKAVGRTNALPPGLIGNENAKAFGVLEGLEDLVMPEQKTEMERFDYLGLSTTLHKIYSESGAPMNEYYNANGVITAQKMWGAL